MRIRVTLPNLKERSRYTVGVRAVGSCLTTSVNYASFETPRREFKQLTGCFIATAAWGSWPSEPVHRVRQARDWMRSRSVAIAVMDELYARSSPPTAAVLAGSSAARALVRTALRPILGLFGQ